MPLVEFVGQSAQDVDNISANPSRLLNCYREPVPSGGVTQHVLKSVLGQVAYADLNTVLVRALGRVGDDIYAVAGGALYTVDEDIAVTNLGAILDDPNASIAGNFGSVGVVSSGRYYLYTSPSITQPTAGAFSDFGSICYVGGYTVLTERNGNKFQWSDLADPTTLDALNFQTADTRDDNILRGFSLNGRLVLFKERSIETWYVTGQANTEAFKRVVGATIDTGLKSFGLITDFSGGLFFVGDDNIAYLLAGGQPQPLANPAVQTAIKQGTATNCFTYEDEGHKFLCIRFSDRPAWCYDLTTGEWHERAETRKFTAWTAIATVERGGNWYAGNEQGQIVSLTRSATDLVGPEETTGPLFRRAISKEVYTGNRFKVKLLEILGRVGRSTLGTSGHYLLDVGFGFVFGLSDTAVLSLGEFTGSPRAASIAIRVSRDGGNTWSELKTRSFGDQGEYEARAVWRSLGQYRRFCIELNWSDPTEMPINATARFEIA